MWIDKYCLDQDNLGEGLMCLPVFLAGCKSLLVLAGSTYPRRLWCVMELFIFLIMGGSHDDVDLRLVCDVRDDAAREALLRDLEAFDATEATCTVQEDENRMLGAIAGAFGSLETFSRDVQRTLRSILRRDGTELEVEVAQQRMRIVELENVVQRITQRCDARFQQLEQQNAHQARLIEELKAAAGFSHAGPV